MPTTRNKPSTLFKNAAYADEGVLRITDKLGVRISSLADKDVNGNARFMIEMPGLVEGNTHSVAVAGFGVYTSLAMVAAAYVAGQKSQK